MLTSFTSDLSIASLPQMAVTVVEKYKGEPSFKEKYTVKQRSAESSRVLQKYPCRIPVICERCSQGFSALPKDSKCKFLIPDDMTLGAFLVVVRRRLELNESQAIFLYVGHKLLIPVSTNFRQIYDQHKDEDNFVYVSYASENVFG